MRISDWCSDVCSSYLHDIAKQQDARDEQQILDDVLILNEQPDNRDRADANGIERPFARPRERCGRLARTLERAFAKDEDDEAGEDADARETEAKPPTHPLADTAQADPPAPGPADE